MDLTKVLIEFFITFAIIYIIYYLLVIKKCKKNKKIVSAEVSIIITLHKIDIKKIDTYQMVKVVSIVTTLILSTMITIIDAFFDSTIISLIFSTLLSLVIAIIIYRMIGNYYKKKSIQKK